jgi:hypothetical protein
MMIPTEGSELHIFILGVNSRKAGNKRTVLVRTPFCFILHQNCIKMVEYLRNFRPTQIQNPVINRGLPSGARTAVMLVLIA